MWATLFKMHQGTKSSCADTARSGAYGTSGKNNVRKSGLHRRAYDVAPIIHFILDQFQGTGTFSGCTWNV